MKNIITIIAILFFGAAYCQNITFADPIFKAKLLSCTTDNYICYTVNPNGVSVSVKLDANNDNEISQTEALAVTYMDIPFSNISNLSGIEYFVNLKYFDCNYNQISSLDLTHFPELEFLECSENDITSLDFSSTPLLKIIRCNNNDITSLDFLNLQYLFDVGCSHNLLTTLDFSNNPALFTVGCASNNLISINIKNGIDGYAPPGWLSYDGWYDNPNLQYICADDVELPWIINEINYSYPNNNISINSYCTLSPGGTSYAITGTNHYDQNNNGCDSSDASFLNLKLNISDGTNSGSVFANNSVNYNILVNAGTHTITSQLENPNYFNISPSTTTVIFPATASPHNQDYCVTANGTHNDLEINLLPISSIKPGFQAAYQIVYQNKGTAQQSGTISFNYDESKLIYDNSDVAFNNQATNVLAWDFANLQPFEKRSFRVWFTANATNNNTGDILSTFSTISGLTDETPTDNTSNLVQTVTNSYDPNDKTCLEGATITTTEVGDYVHYMIRFENNGTANATNVIVEDVIDTTKFDINSLIPIAASHNFMTKITNGKNVAFVFENIDLSFSNINNANDGFIAFKIKTKSTLTPGDSFSNKASIFFDYNEPIVTNTATTTVINPLNNAAFAIDNNFILFPNPSNNNLAIFSEKVLTISSVSIYNTLGQLVQTSLGNINTIEVSQLKSGNYLMKIVHDGGVSLERFIKE